MDNPDELWGSVFGVLALQRTRWGGRPSIEEARRERTIALIRHAREHSRWFRERCAGLPADAGLDRMPVTGKAELMARFDDWVTDPALTRAGLSAFLADRARIGTHYLGRYAAWRSSGTTGEPGLFVHDASARATYGALAGALAQSPPVFAALGLGALAHAGRCALVAAVDQPFAGVVTWRSYVRWLPPASRREISILAPVRTWVGELNGFQPAYLAGYPSALALLAREQVEGRLAISPAVIWSGGEHLGDATRRALERAFRAIVVEEYGSSECPCIAAGCAHGWLHVNADWVVLEAVDAQHRPVAPGVRSHTTLLTNLANRVQPVIRYDLGDRIVARPDACACGSPLPAIRVEGRSGEILTLLDARGRRVDIPPLAIETAVEEATGIHGFQIVRVGDAAIALRLPGEPSRGRRENWRRARAALERMLGGMGLGRVAIGWDPKPPRSDRVTGKFPILAVGPRGPGTRSRGRPGDSAARRRPDARRG